MASLLLRRLPTCHADYGFATLFREVKQKDCTPLREKMKAYLGGHYTDGLAFEHYRDVIDFS